MGQSLSNVLLHIIFSTKNRHPFIDEVIESELYAYITSISVTCGSYVHKIGGVSDHIHLFTTLPRTLSISDLTEEIKKNSSKWIKTKGQKYYNFSWQKGFGVFSVSASQHNAVAAYISNQKEHHKIQSYQDEYRQFLRLNNVPYDERYVWD
jgi:REP element-mobilizing transposase RayT